MKTPPVLGGGGTSEKRDMEPEDYTNHDRSSTYNSNHHFQLGRQGRNVHWMAMMYDRLMTAER
jgi:hypothetical protein